MPSKLFILIIILLSLNLVSALPYYLTPLSSSNAVRRNVTFESTINLTTNSDGTGVILSNTSNFTTDDRGVAFLDINISSLTAIPKYLVESRNGIIRITHIANDQIFRQAYIQFINTTKLQADNASIDGNLTAKEVNVTTNAYIQDYLTISQLTLGSILFTTTNGRITQNNAALRWNDTTTTLFVNQANFTNLTVNNQQVCLANGTCTYLNTNFSGGGPYIYDNRSGGGFLNETPLNQTIYNLTNPVHVRRDTWATHDNYPSDCSAGTFIRGLGDTLNCVAFEGNTSEQMQDSVGGILIDTDTIDVNYDDAGDQITNQLKFTNTSSMNLTRGSSGLVAVVLPAGVDHGGLGGLADDDHPQYVLDSTWTDIDDYPLGCTAPQIVQAIGDTLTCVAERGNTSAEISAASSNESSFIPFFNDSLQLHLKTGFPNNFNLSTSNLTVNNLTVIENVLIHGATKIIDAGNMLSVKGDDGLSTKPGYIALTSGDGTITSYQGTVAGDHPTPGGFFGTYTGHNMFIRSNNVNRVIIDTDGKVLISSVVGAAPSAFLHLRDGTASAGQASLKIDNGTLLATTEAGAVENDGTHLYYTATSGGTRYQLDQQAGANESSFIPVFNDSTQIHIKTGFPRILNLSTSNLTINNLTIVTNASIAGRFICLSDGTNCPSVVGDGSGWSFNNTNGFLFNSTTGFGWNETRAVGMFVNRSLWTTIDNYPSDCSAGSYVRGLGDTLTCVAERGNTSAEISAASSNEAWLIPFNNDTTNVFRKVGFPQYFNWSGNETVTGMFTANGSNFIVNDEIVMNINVSLKEDYVDNIPGMSFSRFGTLGAIVGVSESVTNGVLTVTPGAARLNYSVPLRVPEQMIGSVVTIRSVEFKYATTGANSVVGEKRLFVLNVNDATITNIHDNASNGVSGAVNYTVGNLPYVINTAEIMPALMLVVQVIDTGGGGSTIDLRGVEVVYDTD